MNSVLTLLLCLMVSFPASSQSHIDQCRSCHEAIGDKPSELFKHDVHAEKGIGCAGCHGGDATKEEMEQAMDRSAGFVGVPKGDDISKTCAQCHSNATIMVKKYNSVIQRNQSEVLATSVHGKLSTTGKEHIAQCTTCHDTHGIVSVKNPTSPVYPLNIPGTCGKCHSDENYMQGYADLPGLTQVADYEKSVHYASLKEQGNLSAPTCVTCHSSHGAVPPGARSIADVCGTCHANNRQYFEKSAHAAAFAEMDVRGCVQCHSNHDVQHADERLLAGPDSVCMTCHQEGDTGAQRAQAMAATIRRLDAAIIQAKTTLDEADRAGMDVNGATAELAAAHSHLVISRTAIHSLDVAQVDGEINQGLPIAAKVLQEGKDKLAEVQSRRKGVALFCLLVLGIVLSLYLYIRQENKTRQSSQS